MNIKTLFSFLLIVTFFLPWINIMMFNVSGFEIGTYVSDIYRFISTFDYEIEQELLIFAYSLYLIPLFSIVNIILDLTKTKRLILINEFFVGFALTLFIAFLILQANQNLWEHLFEGMGIGYYTTFILSLVGMFIYSGNPIKSKSDDNSKTEYQNLKSMLDRGVITEEVFIQETDRLFDKNDVINSEEQNITLDKIHFNFLKNIEIIIVLIFIIFGVLLTIYS
jgi:hypothetical protein